MSGAKLGKIPLHGTRGSSARAYHLDQRIRGGQGQARGHPDFPLPGTVRDLKSFLGHVGFYRRFIHDFAKVSKPLTTLLFKDKDFIIDKEGKLAFTMLKQALIEALILQSPNWDIPFKIMCDASDYAVGAVFGQRLDKKPMAICYASKNLVKAQINYTTMEKELLAVVYALEKFRP